LGLLGYAIGASAMALAQGLSAVIVFWAVLGGIRDEIIRINTESRPLALQVPLLIPILAELIGLFNSFRMMRLPDPIPSGAGEGMVIC
jgi:hypothetical protein